MYRQGHVSCKKFICKTSAKGFTIVYKHLQKIGINKNTIHKALNINNLNLFN